MVPRVHEQTGAPRGPSLIAVPDVDKFKLPFKLTVHQLLLVVSRSEGPKDEMVLPSAHFRWLNITDPRARHCHWRGAVLYSCPQEGLCSGCCLAPCMLSCGVVGWPVVCRQHS